MSRCLLLHASAAYRVAARMSCLYLLSIAKNNLSLQGALFAALGLFRQIGNIFLMWRLVRNIGTLAVLIRRL